MKKIIFPLMCVLLFSFLSLLLYSCNSSDSCGGADEASVKYKVDMGDWKVDCLIRLEWLDQDGVMHTRSGINQNPWDESFCASDGAHLYLFAEVECDEVTITLYLDNHLVERKTRDSRATIDGYLKVDDEGNATFEDTDD